MNSNSYCSSTIPNTIIQKNYLLLVEKIFTPVLVVQATGSNTKRGVSYRQGGRPTEAMWLQVLVVQANDSNTKRGVSYKQGGRPTEAMWLQMWKPTRVLQM